MISSWCYTGPSLFRTCTWYRHLLALPHWCSFMVPESLHLRLPIGTLPDHWAINFTLSVAPMVGWSSYGGTLLDHGVINLTLRNAAMVDCLGSTPCHSDQLYHGILCHANPLSCCSLVELLNIIWLAAYQYAVSPTTPAWWFLLMMSTLSVSVCFFLTVIALQPGPFTGCYFPCLAALETRWNFQKIILYFWVYFDMGKGVLCYAVEVFLLSIG